MAGFGWSVGDLVLSGRLLVKIGKALKESGGAREDYQQSARYLLGLGSTLRTLAAFEGFSASHGSAETIKEPSRVLAQHLDGFISSIKTFQDSLGPSGPSKQRSFGIRHSVGKKLRWAMFTSKKVQELQARLALPLASINVNLGIQTMLDSLFFLVIQAYMVSTLSAFLKSTLPASVCREVSGDCNLSTQLQSSLRPLEEAV